MGGERGNHSSEPTCRSDRPAVLYLTNNLPCPPISGGQLREYELLKRLARDFAVHLIAFVRERASPQAMESCRVFLASVAEVVADPGAAPPGMPARMRAHFSPDGMTAVRALLERRRFVLAHVEGYFLHRYLPPTSKLPTVLVAENIEFALEEAATAVGYVGFDAAATRVAEVAAWQRAGICVCVTPEDAAIVRQYVAPDVPVRCVTNGVDHITGVGDVCRTVPDASTTCLYTANYQWTPSRDAAVHLLRDIWPAVRTAAPGSKLMLAGVGARDMTNEFACGSDIILYGEYSTFDEVASRAAVFVFPMRFGGGIKVKLIEAISAGMPVVTTTGALRGFPPEIRQHICVADSPKAFADATIAALAIGCDATTRRTTAAARRVLIAQMPKWAAAADALADIWRTCASDR